MFPLLEKSPKYHAELKDHLGTCPLHPNEIPTSSNEGELFCGKCGIVLGTDIFDSVTNNSRTNLAQDYQLGGKLIGLSKTEIFINSYSKLSQISNICESLRLPDFIRQDVWKWYQKITPLIPITYPKRIFLVIYTMCKYNGIPLKESKLSDHLS